MRTSICTTLSRLRRPLSAGKFKARTKAFSKIRSSMSNSTRASSTSAWSRSITELLRPTRSKTLNVDSGYRHYPSLYQWTLTANLRVRQTTARPFCLQTTAIKLKGTLWCHTTTTGTVWSLWQGPHKWQIETRSGGVGSSSHSAIATQTPKSSKILASTHLRCSTFLEWLGRKLTNLLETRPRSPKRTMVRKVKVKR